MKTDKISFEVEGMHLQENIDMVRYIYKQSTHKEWIRHRHPLDLICDSMKHTHHMEIETIIQSNRHHAYVIMTFDEKLENKMIKKLTTRFQNTTEQLLKAKVMRIYEKRQ